ncbi:MAG TPA: hypothetical protein VLF89_01745 [Candidatus Saccharimonadales bacterium]|nr:hypothetical protein [Candidatus Saccharimonadales bacterium]
MNITYQEYSCQGIFKDKNKIQHASSIGIIFENTPFLTKFLLNLYIFFLIWYPRNSHGTEAASKNIQTIPGITV